MDIVAGAQNPGRPLRDDGVAVKEKIHKLAKSFLIAVYPSGNSDSLAFGVLFQYLEFEVHEQTIEVKPGFAHRLH